MLGLARNFRQPGQLRRELALTKEPFDDMGCFMRSVRGTSAQDRACAKARSFLS